MIQTVLCCGLLLLASFYSVLTPAPAQNAEEAAARVPLENYLKGHATGDPEFFKKAFHPEAKLFWFRDGKFGTRTSAEYIAGASGKPAADETQRKRWIESVNITGNTGVAKLVLDYPQVKFTDYMSLLKVDGEWKIINKTFYAEPKPAAKP
jgi:hypothetical protein